MSDDCETVTLHTLAAEFRAFRELMDERDRRYDERDHANKEAVKAAITAVDRANEKVELANKEYKLGANEWRDTVKDLVGRMPTRDELDRRIHVLEEKIADLRESRSQEYGGDAAMLLARTTQRWLIGLVVTVVLGLVAMLLKL